MKKSFISIVTASLLISHSYGELFFSADNCTGSGVELWKSDGTVDGTFQVKDINPNSNSSYPQNFVQLGNLIYFIAQDIDGYGLYKSDGSESGTERVVTLTNFSTSYSFLTVVGNNLLFVASDESNGFELWKSDGTSAGTMMVKNINPSGNAFSVAINSVPYISLFTILNDELYFSADDGTHGVELWKSDGTTAGTQIVKDIYVGLNSSSSNPAHLTVVNDTLYFSANDGSSGIELWKSDGTYAGTQMVKNIYSGGSSEPQFLTEFNGDLYFSADDGSAGRELWKSDGTTAGTQMLHDIYSGSTGSYPEYLTPLSDSLIFSANDGGYGIWKSDGSAGGTILIKSGPSTTSQTQGSYVNQFSILNDTLFFSAWESSSGVEPWISNGTSSGTSILKDIVSGTSNSSPMDYTKMDGKIYFWANDPTAGVELFVSDGTESGTTLFKDICSGSSQSLSYSKIFNRMIPTIQSDISFYDFSTTTIGTSLSKNFTITNSGSAPLSISSSSITSDFSSFSVTSNSCNSVAIGGSCSIGVTFTPTIAGSQCASVSLISNASNSPFTLSVTGLGQEAYVTSENIVSVGDTDVSIPNGVTPTQTDTGQEITISNVTVNIPAEDSNDNLNIVASNSVITTYDEDAEVKLYSGGDFSLTLGDSENKMELSGGSSGESTITSTQKGEKVTTNYSLTVGDGANINFGLNKITVSNKIGDVELNYILSGNTLTTRSETDNFIIKGSIPANACEANVGESTNGIELTYKSTTTLNLDSPQNIQIKPNSQWQRFKESINFDGTRTIELLLGKASIIIDGKEIEMKEGEIYELEPNIKEKPEEIQVETKKEVPLFNTLVEELPIGATTEVDDNGNVETIKLPEVELPDGSSSQIAISITEDKKTEFTIGVTDEKGELVSDTKVSLEGEVKFDMDRKGNATFSVGQVEIGTFSSTSNIEVKSSGTTSVNSKTSDDNEIKDREFEAKAGAELKIDKYQNIQATELFDFINQTIQSIITSKADAGLYGEVTITSKDGRVAPKKITYSARKDFSSAKLEVLVEDSKSREIKKDGRLKATFSTRKSFSFKSNFTNLRGINQNLNVEFKPDENSAFEENRYFDESSDITLSSGISSVKASLANASFNTPNAKKATVKYNGLVSTRSEFFNKEARVDIDESGLIVAEATLYDEMQRAKTIQNKILYSSRAEFSKFNLNVIFDNDETNEREIEKINNSRLKATFSTRKRFSFRDDNARAIEDFNLEFNPIEEIEFNEDRYFDGRVTLELSSGEADVNSTIKDLEFTLPKANKSLLSTRKSLSQKRSDIKEDDKEIEAINKKDKGEVRLKVIHSTRSLIAEYVKRDNLRSTKVGTLKASFSTRAEFSDIKFDVLYDSSAREIDEFQNGKFKALYSTNQIFSFKDNEKALETILTPIKEARFEEIQTFEGERSIKLISGEANITIANISEIMELNREYTLPNIEEVESEFSADVTLNLNTGWNLISLPVKESIEDFSIFGEYESIIKYENGKWVENPKTISYGEGFFINLAKAKEVKFYGERYNLDESKLNYGWNLVGGEIEALGRDKVAYILNGDIDKNSILDINISSSSWLEVSENELYKIKDKGYFIYKKLEDFNLTLNVGWNLISLPTLQTIEDKTIFGEYEEIFIYKNNSWILNPNILEYRDGIWVKSNSKATIPFYGDSYKADTVNLAGGWSLIGGVINSVKEENLSEIYIFDSGKWINEIDKLTIGKGAWVKR